MNLVGVLGGAVLHQIVVPLVVGVVVDGAQVGFAEGAGIQLPVHEHGLGVEGVVHHEDGDGVKKGAVLVPVGVVLGEDLGVVLDELGDAVGAVVPHGGVVLGPQALHAQLVHLGLTEGQHGGGSAHGVKVGDVLGAVVDDGIVVGGLDAHGVLEEVVGGLQGQGGVLIHVLDGLEVLLRALDHLPQEGAVDGVVLVEVEHPLHGRAQVLGDALGLLVAVHVHPGHVVPEAEGPGQAVVVGAPLLSDAGDQLALGVHLHEEGQAVAQHVQGRGGVVVEDEEGLHLIGLGLVGHQVLDGLALGALGLAGGGLTAAVPDGRSTLAAVAGVLAAASAGGQDHQRGQEQGHQSRGLLFHLVPPDSKNSQSAFPRPAGRTPCLCTPHRDTNGAVCANTGNTSLDVLNYSIHSINCQVLHQISPVPD